MSGHGGTWRELKDKIDPVINEMVLDPSVKADLKYIFGELAATIDSLESRIDDLESD